MMNDVAINHQSRVTKYLTLRHFTGHVILQHITHVVSQ